MLEQVQILIYKNVMVLCRVISTVQKQSPPRSSEIKISVFFQKEILKHAKSSKYIILVYIVVIA